MSEPSYILELLNLPNDILCEILGSAGHPQAKWVCPSFRRAMKDPQVLGRAFGNAYGERAVYRLFTYCKKAFSRHVAQVISVLEVVDCFNIGFGLYDGVRSLAEALKTNATVHTLKLGNNRIGDEGVQALAEALKTNVTVHTLDLYNNKIGDEGARALAEALKTNTTVHTLDLHYNRIGVEGARALAEALKTNATLNLHYSGHN